MAPPLCDREHDGAGIRHRRRPFDRVVARRELTVFTTQFCGMCFALKGWLRDWGVPFREVDIGEDAESREFVRRVARGYLSVPTLLFPDGSVLVEPNPSEVRQVLARNALLS